MFLKQLVMFVLSPFCYSAGFNFSFHFTHYNFDCGKIHLPQCESQLEMVVNRALQLHTCFVLEINDK